MQVATGTVVEGKIVVEGLSLPEGTLVTILWDSEPTFRLSPQEEAELLDSLDEADREEGISAEELFERLLDKSRASIQAGKGLSSRQFWDAVAQRHGEQAGGKGSSRPKRPGRGTAAKP